MSDNAADPDTEVIIPRFEIVRISGDTSRCGLQLSETHCAIIKIDTVKVFRKIARAKHLPFSADGPYGDHSPRPPERASTQSAQYYNALYSVAVMIPQSEVDCQDWQCGNN